MKIRQISFCISLSLINILSFSQSKKFSFGVQYSPELYRYYSISYYKNKTSYKINLNNAFNLSVGYRFKNRIEVYTGIGYIKRTFKTNEGFDQCRELKEGEICPTMHLTTSQQDYHLLEYPLGLEIYLNEQDNKVKLKLIGSIIGKHMIKAKYHFGESRDITEELFQFYGIASNFGVGLDIPLNKRLLIEINSLYRFYNLRREQELLFGDNDSYFTDNKGILNSNFGITYTF